MAQTNSIAQSAPLQGQATKTLQAGFAAFLGLALFALVSFSHSSVIHNGAHDSRHGISTPCH